MEQRPARDYSRCPKCGGVEVERMEVTRGYYSAHAKYDPEVLIRFTDRCASCGTLIYEHIEEDNE
jgi:predicted RNA-binding Zn-ribbon protein involved in translation (DUF1610 family)